jgi:CelD/BcsL family acetyltransferase involved in cellulose biosynthesis
MLETQLIRDTAELQALAPEWAALLPRSASDEPMLSPGWLLAWWRIFGEPEGRELRTVAFRDGARLVGLAPLAVRRRTRLPWTGMLCLELLGTGEEADDGVCSEYVGIVAERGAEEAVTQAFAALLADSDALGPWHHLVLDGMNGDTALPLLLAEELRARRLHVAAELDNGAAYIALPATWDAYLASLPGSRRSLVKRAVSQLERWAGGALRHHRATLPGEVEEGRRILIELHQERWTAAGRPGAFGHGRFRAFHESAMSWLLDSGALDLSWLSVRGEPVAASYSMVWNNKVYYYQGGRSVALPRNLRPGLALHAYNIRAAIADGRREYDFLAGMARYKTELAAMARPLLRLRVVQPSLRESLTQFAAVLRRQLRALRAQIETRTSCAGQGGPSEQARPRGATSTRGSFPASE